MVLRISGLALPFLLTGLPLLASVTAQEQAEDKPPSTNKKLELDMSFEHDPRELHEHRFQQLKWKRIWGPIGIGTYHVYPAAVTGANNGPPQQIWGYGWGASQWRDPVTGWSLQ